MGALAIEKVRAGVEFVPDAAAAFRRADAQVLAEFGRLIDANSTYRSWDKQLSMYDAWNAYVNGVGPYPGHSKAVHPDDSFHVSGLALDSDDWTNARIVQILAENGFIRNRLDVPGEQHHFEWIRSEDRNYGKPIPGSTATQQSEEDDMAKLIRWTSSGAIFKIGAESIYYVRTPEMAIALTKRFGPEVAVDNDDLTAHLFSENLPWDAVDAVLRGAGQGVDGCYWSRQTAEGIAIRGNQDAAAKTLADVLKTAESIAST